MKIIWQKTPNRIVTKEDLLSEHNIDPKEWTITKQRINKRDQAQNKKDWSTVIVELYQVLLELEPKHILITDDYKTILKNLFSWDIPTISTPKPEKTDTLWHIIHTDLHFDRVDHKNPKKYLKEIDDRTMRLFEELLKWKPSKLLYHNLWDYFNTDINQKTTKGTEQYNSIDEMESFQMWLEHQLWLINTFASELPVDAVYTPWNHDRNKLQYLSDAINLYYNKSDNINIDNSHKQRKYYNRWVNTIGAMHGDGARVKQLHNIIPSEINIKKDHNYIYRWHSHQNTVERIGNMIIETIGSPASPSKYDKIMGYNSTDKIHGNLYDKKRGKIFTYYG